MSLAASSPLFFGLLTWMTGGFGSPLFHFILAMPLVIAVVLQEHPWATLAAAVTMLASGVFIVIDGGQPPAMLGQWLIQAAGMSGLAVYASVVYKRLHFREQALREAATVADERARASEAAVQARDEFLTVVSHELRTPLTALRLQASRLLRRSARPESSEETPDPRDEQVVAVMHRQVERLNTLVDSLFEMSRITSGRLNLERQPTAMAPLLRQLVARYAAVARAQGCEVSLEASDDVIVEVDAVRLEQVLTNLLANAVKYGAGKPVQLSLRVRGGRVAISVRDQGIGIAPEDQRRIFERFERATPTRNYGGLGLGLWIGKRLIEEMGGSLSVESRPGEGATFTVELPAGEAPRLHPPVAEA
jgi:signal transduction histidine kinase